SIFIQDGIYANGAQFLTINGTRENPIIIQAINDGEAIFRGGTEAIHLVNCSFIELSGLVIEQQTGNGINIDDGGDYTTPTHHITIRNCIFRDMAANGNNDFLKLSGLDSFLIEACTFTNGGAGGSGVDMVGCHWGTIQDNIFDNAGVTGIQAKGGTQYIRIQRNMLKDMSQRALNLGGSTGLSFFRPPLPWPSGEFFEAADLEVFSNVFIRSWAPIAYVGSVRVKVYNNTFYHPANWVIRILQENTSSGFLACSDNEFKNNIVYLEDDLREVNIGPNTLPATFQFSNNLWYNANDAGNWLPELPVLDSNQLVTNPRFVDASNEDFHLMEDSPCIGSGVLLQEVEVDFDLEPFSAIPSIGAFEGDRRTAATSLTEFNIEVFPNPFSEILRINNLGQKINMALFTMKGQVILKEQISEGSNTLNLRNIPSGVYLIRFWDGNHSFAKVLVRH
ncbi:MAG: T9SS type A sorting domain-containing protein, partial [Bacteroidota bacterium]